MRWHWPSPSPVCPRAASSPATKEVNLWSAWGGVRALVTSTDINCPSVRPVLTRRMRSWATLGAAVSASSTSPTTTTTRRMSATLVLDSVTSLKEVWQCLIFWITSTNHFVFGDPPASEMWLPRRISSEGRPHSLIGSSVMIMSSWIMRCN